jgi:hypothetical protein
MLSMQYFVIAISCFTVQSTVILYTKPTTSFSFILKYITHFFHLNRKYENQSQERRNMSRMFLSKWKPKFSSRFQWFELFTFPCILHIFLMFLLMHYRPDLPSFTWRCITAILTLLLDPSHWLIPFKKSESEHIKDMFG